MAEDINPIQGDRMLGMEQRLTEELKPVNLPIEIPNLVPRSNIGEPEGKLQNTQNYKDIFYNLLDQASPKTGNDFPGVSGSDVDLSGRYPKFYPGRNNEEMYAQSQGGFEKAYNGITKMAGIASATFINGTVGAVYGAIKSSETGKISSFYNNDLANSLNDWTDTLENKYAHYKTEREKNGSWWEPSNVFTGNFLWDGIVKNLGFSLGAAASGFAWGGALKAIGITSKLMSGGVKLASQADDIIANAALLPATQRLSAINSELSAALGSVGKGLMKSDRAIVATFGTIGEAGLEALSSSKAFREQMINDFVADKGYQPTDADLKEIDRLSESVGNFTYFANSALLTATNYIQLPKIFSSSFKNEKNILNNIDFTEGKYIDALPTKGFGKLLYKSKNVASLFFNTSEAFEEGAQFAIQTGTQNYFKKKSKGVEETSAMDDGVLYGIKEAITSDEGTLNIFTGGFSGALQSSGIVGLKNNRPAIGATGKIGERGITGYGGEEGKLREESIVALNKSMIKDKMKDAYSNIKAAEVIQTEREEAIRRGDILESKDLEFDYAHNFITTRLKYNAKESIDFEIASLKQQAITDFLGLKQEGYAAATDTQESFLRRLDNLQIHADNTVKLYEAANLKYKGLVNKETGKPVYTEDVLDQLVYAASKVADYDLRAPQLATNLLTNDIDISGILESVTLNGVPSEEATKEAFNKINALNSINADDLKTDLRDLIELSLRRKQFLDEYNKIKTTPEDFKQPEPITPENVLTTPPLKPGEKVPTVSLKTADGVEDVEIGTEYFLGKTIKYDAEGNPVYRFPVISIIGENEDGTIQIKTPEGNLKNISKEELADYKLGKVSDTINNKKANFFLKNINTVFEFNFGKGNKVKGRLEYDPKGRILLFVYTNKKGQLKTIEVTGDQFVPQKGYKQAMITSVETLTPAQQTVLEEFISEVDDRLGAKREFRLQILNDLFEELSSNQEKTDSLIKKKQEEITKIKKDLALLEEEIANAEIDKRSKNTVRFKSATKTALSSAMKLSRMQTQLEREMETLNSDKDEIEFNLAYVADLAQNIDVLPTESSEFLEEINNQVLDLELLQEKTGAQISVVVKLIKETEKAIDSAVDFLTNLISKFEAKYPNVPRIMGQEFVDFLKINPNFLKVKPLYREELSELDDLITNVEDGDISINEQRIKDLNEHLDIIQKDAVELQKEIVAKQLILDRFESVAKAYKQKLAEEALIKNNEAIVKQILGTLNQGTQNTQYDKAYEPDAKKPEQLVDRATIVPSKRSFKETQEEEAPYHARANQFGIKLNTLPNRNKIKGVVVNSTNQDEIIPGLTEFLKQGKEDVDSSTTVSLVMAIENKNGTYTPVDENGKPLTKEKGESQEEFVERLYNQGIFQVFPLSIQNLFSESVNKETVIKRAYNYTKWREEALASSSLKGYDVQASFGIPEFVQKWDDDKKKFVTDYDAKVSTQDAGLITDSDLRQSPVVYVPTQEEKISLGSTSFSKALGRPFLRLKNAYQPLNNRQHTDKEANAIYDALQRLATVIVEENTKGKFVLSDSPEAMRLIDWLRTVTHWGTPREGKNPSYNSLWFDKTAEGFKLFMSGKEVAVSEFTPTDLAANKGTITMLLQKMYANTNSKLTDSTYYNQRYEQIISVTSEGQYESVVWPNYQTYLLSNKAPDATGKLSLNRASEDIPLTTYMAPVKEGQPNRAGIYFFIDTKDFDKQATDVAPEGKAITIQTPGTPAKPVEKAPVAETPKGKFVLDGETPNTITLTKLDGNIKFVYDPATPDTLKDFEVDIKVKDNYKKTLTQEAVDKYISDRAGEETISEETAKEALTNAALIKYTFNEIAKDVAALEQAKQEAAAQAPVVEAAPEVKAEITTEEITPAVDQQLDDAWDSTEGNADDPELREMVSKTMDQYEGEDWNKVEAFLKKVLPANIPVYRVKNVLRSTNGKQAWGMFSQGAIYVYRNAEVGTAYHEVFEAIWKMFTDPKEQALILSEFKNRPGSFVDRVLGKTIKYSEATPQQAKEELAEEFRAYINNGILPTTKVEGQSLISRLFKELVAFIKNFFTGDSASNNTKQLFERIGSGYYKTFIPEESTLSFAKDGIIDIENAEIVLGSELSEIPGLTNSQIHEIMQHMTFLTLGYLQRDDQSLFAVTPINKTELYGKIQANLREKIKGLSNIAQAEAEAEKDASKKASKKASADKETAKYKSLFNSIILNWEELLKTHEIYLKKYDVEFDDNDSINLNDPDKTGKGEYDGADKIDHFRKLNSATKLLLSTLPVLNQDGKPKPTSIGGVQLIPLSEAWVSVMSNVHDALSTDDMLEKLRTMAKEDPNYETLFKRLTKVSSSDEIDWSLLKRHDVQLIAAFSTAFNKQNPDVKMLNILANEDVQVGDSNLSTATRQIESRFINGLRALFNNPKNPYFEYNTKQKAYIAKEKAFNGVKINTLEEKVKFLASLGIEFDASDLRDLEITNPSLFEKFNIATTGIKTSMTERKKIATIGGRALDINSRLLTLASIKAKIENPDFASTFYAINGEKSQTFIGTNPSSDLYKALSAYPTYESLKDSPQYSYLYTDSFAQNSVLLNSIFNIDPETKTGSKRTGGDVDQLLKPAAADGTNDQGKGKKKASSSLNFKERMVQEINMNLDGYYYNLVAGDASREYMTYMGNPITKEDMRMGYTQIHNIFRGYLIDEINLVREKRPVAKKRKNSELRFMQAILGEELSKTVLSDKTISPEEIYNKYKSKIDSAVEKFIKTESEKVYDVLEKYSIISKSDDGETHNVESLAFAQNRIISNANLDLALSTLTANYIINNIEFHKVLYSDPYQYSEELKRIKNFLSPRQAIINNSPEMNSVMNRVWNEGYEPGDIGYTDFTQDHFTSTTLEDVQGVIDLPDYEPWDEGDGGGMISMKAYRNLRIRASNWNDMEELQYRYDVAWEKRDRKIPLSQEEMDMLAKRNPGVTSTYTAQKPIVAGNKGNGRPYNDVILDKFALYPLSYRVQKEIAKNGGRASSNLLKLYDKMQLENIDYVVFNTARKVGAESPNPFYDVDGKFNTTPYKGKIKVPFAIMSIQSDVPSKEEPFVTRGSQVTKLVTMDFMNAGVPIDYEKGYDEWSKLSNEERRTTSPLFREIQDNQMLLEEMTEMGYQTLLNKLGIEEKDDTYVIVDKSKAGKALNDEILRREVNSNIVQALKDFLSDKSALEATPAYSQIKSILYSLVDKYIVSPKISGGLKVQIPSTGLEEIRAEKTSINGKEGYTSDVLKFYEKDGKRVAEIMVGRWFNTNMSDEKLLEYLNNTPEGQKILSGIAFRIPTQKQNSIDSFVIKQFLPKEFGDSVVVPSALVRKVGSDFDIDKLSIYFKNVYTTAKGDLKIVPYFGIGDQAKQKIKDLIIKEDIEYVLLGERNKDLDKIEDDYDVLADRMYRKSLENAYIQSLQNLVSSEANYEQLIKPNSAKQLKDLADNITKKLGEKTFESDAVGNMLDRTFMDTLRHAFVRGKYAIGIAAVAQTNHSLNQRQPIYIDESRFANLDKQDKFWLTGGSMNPVDMTIKLPEYNKMKINGKEVPTLSMIKNAERSKKYPKGQHISDIIGQFIDGYVDISKGPWIMQLGAKPNVASTFLFLVKLGVPIDTVAFFMNQPIILDYLQEIENAGYSYLFIDSFVEAAQEKYKTSTPLPNQLPSTIKLGELVGAKEFTPEDKAVQQVALTEFLKYAKMSEQLLYVTQGTNYDTASLGDPFLVFKKSEQLERAKKSIISSADFLLENSFIRKTVDRVEKMRSALGDTIFLSDRGKVRQVLEDVLSPYTLTTNDRDFLKISRKAVNDFFDWAVQLTDERNQFLKLILLSDDNAPTQITNLKNDIAQDPTHPLYDNHIIGKKGILVLKSSDRPGRANNLSIDNKDNKIYDQDQIIYSFREMRNYFISIGDLKTYKKIVAVSILQSGLSVTPYSFTSLLPYEDFQDVYGDVINSLEERTDIDLMDYYKLNVLQRNNWSDNTIVPHEKARGGISASGRWYYNMPMVSFKDTIKTAIANGQIPQLIKLSTRSRATQSDAIVYTWEANLSKKEKQEMRKIRDYSFIKRGLFVKVYNDDLKTDPVVLREKQYENFVYKMVNAWGDGFRANEFYDTERPSVFDNDFIPVQKGSYIKQYNFFGDVLEETIYTSPERTDAEIRKFLPTSIPLQKEEVVFGEGISQINQSVKSFNIGDKVIDNNYNVWSIISQEEYEKESKVGMKAGVKVRFITNVNSNLNRREDVLNPDSTTYIKPNSLNTLGENTTVSLYTNMQPAVDKDWTSETNESQDPFEC